MSTELRFVFRDIQVQYVALIVHDRRRGGLVVGVLDSGSNGPGSGPGWGYRVVFLGKTLYSHGASLYPGVQMGAGELLGITLRWTSEYRILLVASC